MADTEREKKSNRVVQWVIPSVLLLVYFVYTIINYNVTMKEASRLNSIDKVNRQAIQISSYYEGALDTRMDMARSAAGYCLKSRNIFDEKNIEYLSSLKSCSKIVNAYIVKPDETAMDYRSNYYVRVNDSEAFRSVLSGSESAAVMKDERGSIVLLLSAPIRDEFEMKGTVVLVFTPNEIANILETPSYNYGIVFADGTIAEQTGTGNSFYNVGDLISDKLEHVSYESGSYNSLKQMIEIGRAGNVLVKNEKGEKKYLITQPVKGYDCSVIIAVNNVAIQRSSSDENKNTLVLVLKLLISMMIFVTLICIIYIINRIAYKRENKELKNKAETDLLTNLLNKISTEAKIKEYIEGEGYNKTCMMCVLDIDNFKKINDTMGHAFGDEVLSTLGKSLKSEFRVTDVLGRLGGDEFVIFLKDMKDEDYIKKETARIENFFKDFTVGRYTKYSPTASIGVALYPRDAQNFDDLYKAADTALYKAKTRGKNQLAFYRDSAEEVVPFVTEEEKKLLKRQ